MTRRIAVVGAGQAGSLAARALVQANHAIARSSDRAAGRVVREEI